MLVRRIRITIGAQKLELLEGERVLAVYPVSTAAKGAGERMGSEQTPRGRHEVRELIGRTSPAGAVFVGRRETGEICASELRRAHPERDWILTRIIRLGGLEDGRNRGGEVDTFARCIYVHGTADEELIGTPGSHGCIRMRNADVIALFDAIAPGTLVEIDP